MKPELSAGCHQTLSLVGGVWGRDYTSRPCAFVVASFPGLHRTPSDDSWWREFCANFVLQATNAQAAGPGNEVSTCTWSNRTPRFSVDILVRATTYGPTYCSSPSVSSDPSTTLLSSKWALTHYLSSVPTTGTSAVGNPTCNYNTYTVFPSCYLLLFCITCFFSIYPMLNNPHILLHCC